MTGVKERFLMNNAKTMLELADELQCKLKSGELEIIYARFDDKADLFRCSIATPRDDLRSLRRDRTAAHSAESGDARAISDEMVQLACEAYDVAYVDDDMDKGAAMRAALKAALANPAPSQGDGEPQTPARKPDEWELAQFLCEDLALEDFDEVSRTKYLGDAKAIIEFLSSVTRPHGGCACTSIDRSHCQEPNCTFARPDGKTP